MRLLIEDFDSLPVAVAAREPAPDPVFGCGCDRCRADAGLPHCRAAARDEGLRLGRAERADLMAGQAAALAASLDAALARAGSDAAEIAEASAEAIGRAVIAMAAAALPATFARLGAAEARRVAEAVLPALRAEPAVTIAAAPEAITLLDRLPAARTGRVRLEPTEGGPGDIAIVWQGGGASRDSAAALAGTRAVLAEFGLLPAPILEETAHG